jgi:hypothetical protein
MGQAESTFALRGAGASAVGKYDSIAVGFRNSLGMELTMEGFIFFKVYLLL